MPLNKVTQISATIINYPYMDKDRSAGIPVPLVVDSAVFYNPDNMAQSSNVEPYLSKLLVNNRLEFIVENETFGGNRNDPAPGVVKELKIKYTYNNVCSELVCKEKSTVVLLAY